MSMAIEYLFGLPDFPPDMAAPMIEEVKPELPEWAWPLWPVLLEPDIILDAIPMAEFTKLDDELVEPGWPEWPGLCVLGPKNILTI